MPFRSSTGAPPASRQAPPRRRATGAAGWLLAAVWLCYLTTAGGSLTSTDAVYIFELTRAIVEDGSIALSPELDPPDQGIDGRYYSQWGIGHSLYGIPSFVAGGIAEGIVGTDRLPRYTVSKALFAVSSTVPAAACVALCFLLAWSMTADARGAAVSALALGFGTLLWPYSQIGFNQPLASVLLMGSALLLWCGVRRFGRARLERGGAPGGDALLLDGRYLLLGSGALLGMAWATRHEMVLSVFAFAAFVWYESDRDAQAGAIAGPTRGAGKTSHGRAWPCALGRLAWLAPGVVVAGLLIGYYNLVRFGSPIDFGNSEPLGWEGFWGYLFAPGGSLLLFSPIVGLGVWGLASLTRCDRGAALLLGSTVGLFFVFYAALDNWAGGRSYGPRFLVPLLGFLCVALAAVARQWRGGAKIRLLWTVLALSVVVQLPGVLIDYAKVADAYVSGGGRLDAKERVLDLETSALVLNAGALVELVPRDLGMLVGLRARQPLPSIDPGTPFGARLAGGLDLWWLHLYRLGLISRTVALLVPTTLIVLAGVCFVRFRLRLADIVEPVR